MSILTSTDQAKLIAARRITRLHDQILFKEQTIEMIHQCKELDEHTTAMIRKLQDEIFVLKSLISTTYL